MRYYLESLGCRLNYAEMAALSRRLTEEGHELADSAGEADICILNSCAVTDEAARKSRQIARQLAHASPCSRLVLTGCFATLYAPAASALPNVALVVDNEQKEHLPEVLRLLPAVSATPMSGQPSRAGVTNPGRRVAETPEGTEEIPERSRTRAFIKVQDGCRNRCTYCVVTVARGEERSRRVAEVVREVNSLAEAGYREAVLTGVHLGAYGADTGESLSSLLAALLAETSIPRLRLSSLEPFDLSPELFRAWGESGGRLMPHLHLPAQSGSDEILRRMGRRNRVADYEALVTAARVAIPGLTVTTDLMTGFPGESESQFAETLSFAARMRFAHIHVFTYSQRPGTAAASFPDQIPVSERRRRSQLLSRNAGEISRSVRSGFLGQVRPVLWESRVSSRSAGSLKKVASAVWSGLTDNYLRVHMRPQEEEGLQNRIHSVRLIALDGTTFQGELAP